MADGVVGVCLQIEGVHIESKQDANVLRLENENEYCPICPNKLGMTVHHTVCVAVYFQWVSYTDMQTTSLSV